MRRLAIAAGALIASTIAGGADLRPLANGDSIAGFGVYVGQQDGVLTFSKIGDVTYKLVIDPDGFRHYVDRNGSAFWIYDRHFKRVLFQGRDLPPDQFVELLPPDGKVEAGMQWDVPAHRTRAVCGVSEARFKAVATKGPDIPLSIDGVETPVPTIRIAYESPLQCGQAAPFLRTMQVLFSPALYEIVQSETVNYDGMQRGPLSLGDQGRGWRVRAIARAAAEK